MAEQPSPKTQKRLKILGSDEVKALYALPQFTDDERQTYFLLTPPEESVLSQFGSIPSRIYFILQLGYFKARYRFFVFDMDDAKADAAYVQTRYFPNAKALHFKITKVIG